MKLSDFNFNLPIELIAQKQIKPRDHSRLLVLDKNTKKIDHDYFYNLDKYLDSGNVLVLNNSKVFPARIKMEKETGGKIEVFLLNKIKEGEWETLIGGKIGKNCKFKILNFKINQKLKIQILEQLPNGNYIVKFNLKGKKFREWLEKYGETPLPPYIKTRDSIQIRKDYQTMYAKTEGSVAAPTAGLHFTKEVFEKLKKKGVKIEYVTLHVGQGTFAPVKTDMIEEHKMHAEYVILDKATAERLNKYKQEGRKIIAVGTTSCRVLEAMSDEEDKIKSGSKWINIFIYPGYKFKFVDSIITNFHLPKSTLLMLISALAGKTLIKKAYKEAIKKKYRFYSFGDSMFIK